MLTKLIKMGLGADKVGAIPFFRYRVLSFLNLKREMEINIFDTAVTVRTGTPDLCVALSSASEYESLSKVLPEDFSELIVDAGAYIGTSAIVLARMYPNATVICIEPSTENFEVLKKNTAPFANIVCLNAALVGKNNKRAKLSNRGTGAWGYTIVDNPLDNPEAQFIEDVDTVTVVSLSEMFANKKIGLLKLDIEGGERDLLTDDTDSLREIPVIFAELHDRIVRGCTEAFEGFSADRWLVKANGEKLLSLSKMSR